MEIKKKFFQKGSSSKAARIEYLEKEINHADSNPNEAGALLRRDRA